MIGPILGEAAFVSGGPREGVPTAWTPGHVPPSALPFPKYVCGDWMPAFAGT